MRAKIGNILQNFSVYLNIIRDTSRITELLLSISFTENITPFMLHFGANQTYPTLSDKKLEIFEIDLRFSKRNISDSGIITPATIRMGKTLYTRVT